MALATLKNKMKENKFIKRAHFNFLRKNQR